MTMVMMHWTKASHLKHRVGGLVHGSHCNGTIKQSDSTSSNKSQPAAANAPVPVKTHTVIDQGPVPLYCSDECQIKDLSSLCGAFKVDYNPNQHSVSLPPILPNSSFRTNSGSYFSGTTSSVNSLSSSSPVSSSSMPPSPKTALSKVSPSLATLFFITGRCPLSCLSPRVTHFPLTQSR
jgi:hypothetical protein